MLESQIIRWVSSSSTSLGRLPSKLDPNPKQHFNCIVLRTGKQLEAPKDARVGLNGEKNYDVHANALHSEDEPQKKKPASPKPYMPPLPFLQRFTEANLDAQFGKFLDVFKKLHVSIPFIYSLP